MFLALLEKLTQEIKKDIPGFRIEYKDETKDLKFRFVAFIVGLFNKRFKEFTTTLYPVIYFPRRNMDPETMFFILAHEYVHLSDEKQNRLYFPISYLMPQIFSLFSILSVLAVFSLWFLFFLSFLLFLLPLPSLWRTHWELRGYAMSVDCKGWLKQAVTQEYLNQVLEHFVNWDYYRMARSRKDVVLKLTNYVNNPKINDKPYEIVKKLIQG